MAEINVQVRQAWQRQATQVQLQTYLRSVIGKHLRGFPTPARKNTFLSLMTILKARRVGLSLARANVALVFAAARKRPGVQLLLQGVELLLESGQFSVGTAAQTPDPLPGVLHAFVRVQAS